MSNHPSASQDQTTEQRSPRDDARWPVRGHFDPSRARHTEESEGDMFSTYQELMMSFLTVAGQGESNLATWCASRKNHRRPQTLPLPERWSASWVVGPGQPQLSIVQAVLRARVTNVSAIGQQPMRTTWLKTGRSLRIRQCLQSLIALTLDGQHEIFRLDADRSGFQL